ncbi:tetratricopeptide repeat protein 17-like [Neocloeon triangulifer]|uniref:tetratricopeptide repeat protein 17-like n=1 Tax=Neocloeon triangulifer TaxID=2078957 RepID=UPI00286EE50A|nr:tetratricopeptide repeat protein 17-like [Neocloeon triangulifer]
MFSIVNSEMPCVTFLALYILSFHVLHINSKTSTYWKLTEDGKIEPSPVQLPGLAADSAFEEDEVFNIITSTVRLGTMWSKRDEEHICVECPQQSSPAPSVDETNLVKNESENNSTESKSIKLRLNQSESKKQSDSDEQLDCGKPVNYTYYDHLVGIANRHTHPNVPEPQTSLIFYQKSGKGTKRNDFDIAAVEKRLLKAKREKPKSVQLYNQIGNFWRVKGDTQKSIECFRRALAVSPNNAEVLLNLARVLFNLQYLDDAISLTRRSLEVQPPDKSPWQQYFTLGEILKAYGHYQEAAVHLRNALELKPEFEPALAALRDIENVPAHAIHVYTVLIIVCLVLGVLLIILSSMDGQLEEIGEVKGQSRHFNRAMAMRSIKMGISSKSQLRARRN